MKLSINLQHLIEFKSTLTLSRGGPELLNLDDGNVSLLYEMTSTNFDLYDKLYLNRYFGKITNIFKFQYFLINLPLDIFQRYIISN